MSEKLNSKMHTSNMAIEYAALPEELPIQKLEVVGVVTRTDRINGREAVCFTDRNAWILALERQWGVSEPFWQGIFHRFIGQTIKVTIEVVE